MPACWNRRVGWLLLVTACGLTVLVDLWPASLPPPALGPAAMLLPPVLGGLAALALLQFLVQHLGAPTTGTRAPMLIACVSVVYAGGMLLALWVPRTGWIAVGCALLNLYGLLLLWADPAGAAPDRTRRVLLLLVALGIGLDAAFACAAACPLGWMAQGLGATEGLRLRFLRLARAASVALPLLTLLFQDLRCRTRAMGAADRWGERALLLGALLMPPTLCLAALVHADWKYLLPLPADATVLGALAGFWLALRRGDTREQYGWGVIAVSVVVGLLMGGFAFDGPLPPPRALGSYVSPARRLTREAHAYTIALALAALAASRATGVPRR